MPSEQSSENPLIDGRNTASRPAAVVDFKAPLQAQSDTGISLTAVHGSVGSGPNDGEDNVVGRHIDSQCLGVLHLQHSTEECLRYS